MLHVPTAQPGQRQNQYVYFTDFSTLFSGLSYLFLTTGSAGLLTARYCSSIDKINLFTFLIFPAFLPVLLVFQHAIAFSLLAFPGVMNKFWLGVNVGGFLCG